LESVDEEKDVGVMVHNSLKPSTQCTKAAKKANQVLVQMACTFHFRDKVTWVKLYKTYIRCHLEYTVQAWCPLDTGRQGLTGVSPEESNQDDIGAAVKGVLRQTCGGGLMSLESRRKRGDVIQVWKILHGKEDVDAVTWFTMASQGGHSM
jgi:hypothetical protein